LPQKYTLRQMTGSGADMCGSARTRATDEVWSGIAATHYSNPPSSAATLPGTVSVPGLFYRGRRKRQMSEETDNRVMECLGMADEASRKADAASFASDARFWRRMEQRWLRLAQTYRATDAMTAAWLRAAPQPARHPDL
jgi:hypothetical protein